MSRSSSGRTMWIFLFGYLPRLRFDIPPPLAPSIAKLTYKNRSSISRTTYILVQSLPDVVQACCGQCLPCSKPCCQTLSHCWLVAPHPRHDRRVGCGCNVSLLRRHDSHPCTGLRFHFRLSWKCTVWDKVPWLAVLSKDLVPVLSVTLMLPLVVPTHLAPGGKPTGNKCSKLSPSVWMIGYSQIWTLSYRRLLVVKNLPSREWSCQSCIRRILSVGQQGIVSTMHRSIDVKFRAGKSSKSISKALENKEATIILV